VIVKRPYFLLVLVVLVGIFMFLAVRAEGAGGKSPELVLLNDKGDAVGFVWYDNGTTFARIYEESFVQCDCSQFPTCAEVSEDPSLTPSETPSVTPVPTEPTSTPSPDPACNRGIGNGSEDCDPGNSYGKGGGGGRPAGEDREEGVLP
jgi:hypothetical protein